MNGAQQLQQDLLQRIEREAAWPPVANSRPTSSGVRNMPKMLEADAAQMAAGTLPPAIEVKAIDDCTVEGRTQRKRMPV